MAAPNVKKLLLTLLGGTFAQTGYYGLPDLATTPALLADIYQAPAYTSQDRTRLASFFLRNIPVMGEYPQEAALLPAVFVQRTGSAEQRTLLGDEMGFADDLDDDETAVSVQGTLLNENYQVSIWATGGTEMRDTLFLAVRYLLLRGRHYLHSAGVMGLEMTSGRDGQMFRPQDDPLVLHAADISLSCVVPLEWTTTQEKPEDLISRAYRPSGYADEDDTGEVGVIDEEE